MENQTKETKWFSICLATLLLATMAVNGLSAYIRLQEAGLGCATWPGCYGRVGEMIAPPESAPMAALTPTQTAKQAHRGIATALVILVLLVVIQARQRTLPAGIRAIPYALVAVVLLLSVIGPASYLKTLPAVATANLAGGMALLALAWALWLGVHRCAATMPQGHRRFARVALAVLSGQILLGAWVSANFAATACSGFLQCPAEAPGGGLSSFWYLRELSVTGEGRIAFDGAQPLIQRIHHAGALLTALTVVGVGALSLRTRGAPARWGVGVLCLLSAQIALGMLGLYLALPLTVVLAHNLVAALLLLCLLRLALLAADPVGS